VAINLEFELVGVGNPFVVVPRLAGVRIVSDQTRSGSARGVGFFQDFAGAGGAGASGVVDKRKDSAQTRVDQPDDSDDDDEDNEKRKKIHGPSERAGFRRFIFLTFFYFGQLSPICYNTTMPSQIAEKTFFKYLKCPSWVYKDAHEAEAALDPLFLRLIDDGLLPEREREVVSDRLDFVEVAAEDPEEAFRQTLEFMRQGRETIYQGVLVHGHWVGNPDVLAKVEGRSKFGNYYYVAADIKRNREIREAYKYQGCFYAELLSRLQGVKPIQGYIMTPDKNIVGFLIEEFESWFHLTLGEIERIVAGEKPRHFLTAGCKQSPWYSACRLDTEECNDLSVLNRVWREEVVALQKVGIKTLNDLSSKTLKQLEKLAPAVRGDRLELLSLQAKALIENKHFLLSSPPFPKADTELYFDIESDPLRDFDFLFGVLEVKKGQGVYHSFLSERPEDEPQMWRSFVDFLLNHRDAPIYHYGWFELEVFRRFAAKYSLSDELRTKFELHFHDLLFLIRPSVIFPLSFYSLKDLGAYVGYKWQSEDASGVQAVRWFEDFLNNGDRQVLDKILEYNKDDVQATWKLKEWVAKQFDL